MIRNVIAKRLNLNKFPIFIGGDHSVSIPLEAAFYDWCLENNKDRTLSINARNKVLSNYTIDIVAKQYKDLYKSLV